jgi:hypothetical protein
MHADRTNRAMLVLLAAAMMAAGGAAGAASLGAFGSPTQHATLLDNPAGHFVGTHGDWLWPAAAVVAAILVLLAFGWLIALLFSTDRSGDLQISPRGQSERTILAAPALTEAVLEEIGSYRGVSSARARLLGDPSDPRLAVTAALEENADFNALRRRIETEALVHARLAVEDMTLPTRLDLTVTSKRGARAVLARSSRGPGGLACGSRGPGRGLERVLHQHGGGDRADTARHRGQDRGDPGHGRGVHVAGQTPAVRGAGAHVDHHGTWADVPRPDQVRLAGRRDEDVRLPADGPEILSPRMRDGDRGVLGEQQQRGWLAHHRGPANHDRAATAQRDPFVPQDGQHGGGGGRGEDAREPGRQPAQRGRAGPVDVLAGRDQRGHAGESDSGRQRGLADDAVHRRVQGQFRQAARDLLRAGSPAHVVDLAGDSGPAGGPLDGPDVPCRSRVVRGDQHREGGGDPGAAQHGGCRRGRRGHRHGDCPAVHEVGHPASPDPVREVDYR